MLPVEHPSLFYLLFHYLIYCLFVIVVEVCLSFSIWIGRTAAFCGRQSVQLFLLDQKPTLFLLWTYLDTRISSSLDFSLPTFFSFQVFQKYFPDLPLSTLFIVVHLTYCYQLYIPDLVKCFQNIVQEVWF